MPIKIVNHSDLDNSQKEVVMLRPFDQQVYISGPPGSGKTSVAILRTKMLLENGFSSMLFVLYNHSLYGYLSTIFRRMNISSNTSINTKDKYFFALARHLRCLPDSYFDIPNYEMKYNMLLDNLLSSNIAPVYEMCMIDEAQDFSEKELRILRRLSKKVIAVADFDQKIYDTNATELLFNDLKRYKLETVYRFGRDIAAVVEQLSKSGERLTGKVTQMGSTKPYLIKSSGSDAIDALCNIIKNKKLSDGTMAIISPLRKNLTDLSAILSSRKVDHFVAPTNDDFRNYNFDSNKPLLIPSLSSKGLEFDTVVLYKYSGGMWDSQMRKNILYVSLSRACRDLYIIEDSGSWIELKNLKGITEMSANNKGGSQDDDYEF
ncbi:MAG: UvrD-helicase domain-containing protein [Bacteroidales bacterium]